MVPAVDRQPFWEFTRTDGFVFRCDLFRQAREWMLMLACNGGVFARRTFDSRQEAEAWADAFLAGMQQTSH